jgi:hypothetical protein
MKDVATQLQITAVPPAVLDVVWPQVAPLLEKATNASNAYFGVDEVYNRARTGEYLLWLVLDGTTPVAALTTRITIYPKAKALCLDWIGGERMREWLPLAQKLMERYGKDNDCTHLEGYGRKAWGRWLQPHGWKPEYIAYKMDLTHG